MPPNKTLQVTPKSGAPELCRQKFRWITNLELGLGTDKSSPCAARSQVATSQEWKSNLSHLAEGSSRWRWSWIPSRIST